MDDNKYAAQDRYHKKVGRVSFLIQVSPKTESDILEAIRSQGPGNQSTYIKRLIREDIERNKKTK